MVYDEPIELLERERVCRYVSLCRCQRVYVCLDVWVKVCICLRVYGYACTIANVVFAVCLPSGEM